MASTFVTEFPDTAGILLVFCEEIDKKNVAQ